MPSVSLILGPVSFSDFEVPERINFGGDQILSVHQLTDGRRVIDIIGPAETKIVFSGTFSGSTAAPRARQIDSLRSQGNRLSLSWDQFVYAVIISRFEADYRNRAWIPFRISCTVLRDEAASASPTPPSLTTLALSDLGVASDNCASYGLDFLGAKTAIACSNATTQGTAAFLTAETSLSSLRTLFQAFLVDAQNALQGLALSDDSSPVGTITSFMASIAAVQQLAELSFSEAYLRRASKNMSNAST
jgi:hypothetical protein